MEFFVNGEVFSFTDVTSDGNSPCTFTKVPPRDSPVRGSHRDRRSVHVHEQRRRYSEQTIDIHDHRVVLTDEPDNEQGSAPITLFEFTATNQSNKPLMPLLPQLLPRLQSKQLADAPFPHQASIGPLVNAVPKDESVESARAFVLEDTTTPIELIVHDRPYTRELGRATYPVS